LHFKTHAYFYVPFRPRSEINSAILNRKEHSRAASPRLIGIDHQLHWDRISDFTRTLSRSRSLYTPRVYYFWCYRKAKLPGTEEALSGLHAHSLVGNA